MKKYIWLLLVVLLLAGSATIYRQAQAAQAARAEIIAARRRRTEILHEVEKARQLLAREQAKASNLAAARAESQAKSAADPELQSNRRRAAFLQRAAASLGLHYAAMYRKLGLTRGQIATYEGLELGYIQTILDIQDSAKAKNIPPNDPAIGNMVVKEWQQVRQEETALLGDSAMQETQEFNRSAMVRSVANIVAGDVYYTDTPLTADQGDKLTQILANNSASYQSGGPAHYSDINAATALTQAQAVLSPAQLAALANLFQGATAWTLLQSRISALTAASAP